MAGDRELWNEAVCAGDYCPADCEHCPKRDEVLEVEYETVPEAYAPKGLRTRQR